MRVGIVAQRNNETATALAEEVLTAIDVDEVVLDPETATALDRGESALEQLGAADLVVSIGGDGTFLFAARHAGTTPILGVNLGEVGFLTPIQPGNAVEAVRNAIVDHRGDSPLQTTQLPRLRAEGADWSLPPAINEIVVQSPQRGRGNAITVQVEIDDRQYIDRAVDGVLVATPTGSTAYNLSEGGPLLRPETGVMIVTPMSPQPAARPLIIDDDSVVAVHVTAGAADSTIALADGSQRERLQLPATITINQAGEPIHVVGDGLDLFRGLEKLR